MADQPDEVVISQTNPGHTSLTETTGARSAYDPVQQSPQDVSAAALAGQLRDLLSCEGLGTDSAGSVQRSTTQITRFPPVTWHTPSFGYEIPMG
jgi:hypothetical protein